MTALLDIDQLLDQMETGLRQALEQRGVQSPVRELDISFYRDDFSRIGLNPRVKPSSLPFDTEGRDIILIDDVIMSGRTIRAAMNEIFDYGRPASIILATLIDLGARELPIQPDVAGKTMALESHQRVKLTPLSRSVSEPSRKCHCFAGEPW